MLHWRGTGTIDPFESLSSVGGNLQIEVQLEGGVKSSNIHGGSWSSAMDGEGQIIILDEEGQEGEAAILHWEM